MENIGSGIEIDLKVTIFIKTNNLSPLIAKLLKATSLNTVLGMEKNRPGHGGAPHGGPALHPSGPCYSPSLN